MTIAPEPADNPTDAAPITIRVAGPGQHFLPRSVFDETCPSDHAITETTDRRLLWHLSHTLSLRSRNEDDRALDLVLKNYLHETCEHHFHDYSGYMDIPAVWQCLWCNAVVTAHPGTPEANN